MKKTLGPLDYFNYLATAAHTFLPSDPHFRMFHAYFDGSTSESRSIWLIYAICLNSLYKPPAHFTREQKAACKNLFKLIYDAMSNVLKGDGPTKPNASNWGDLKELCRFAEQEEDRINFLTLANLLFYCLPDHTHFKKFRAHYESKTRVQTTVRTRLYLALHSDHTQKFDENKRRICTEAARLVIEAWKAYEQPRN